MTHCLRRHAKTGRTVVITMGLGRVLTRNLGSSGVVVESVFDSSSSALFRNRKLCCNMGSDLIMGLCFGRFRGCSWSGFEVVVERFCDSSKFTLFQNRSRYCHMGSSSSVWVGGD